MTGKKQNNKSKKKKKTKADGKSNFNGNEDSEEYGVVLKKEEKLKHRIYPQKGKKPKKKEDDSYKIV
ncbi:MAG: hypothetical protein GF364_18665 [Candidatus Lokiarchaeota archaeon]|nr:hypothetical protein [Candidatus Lokiarchaeota archaeon]